MFSWMKQISIRGKLLLLVFSLTIGLVGTGWWAISVLKEVMVNGPHYNKIVTDKDLIADILPPPAYIIESLLVANLALDEKDPAEVTKLIENLRAREKEYGERHEFWVENLLDPAMRTSMLKDAYNPALRFYDIMNKRFIPALERGDKAEAARIKVEEMLPEYMTHRKAIDTVVQLATDDFIKVEGATRELVDTHLLFLTILIVVLPIAVILFIAIPVYLSITRPLREVTDIAQDVAQGSVDKTPAYTSGDDLGRLAESFRQVVSYLNRMAESAECITDLDLTRSPSPKSSNDRLGHAFADMSEKLEAVIASVSDGSMQVMSGAEQISATSQSLSQAATEQAASLEEIDASINDIGSRTQHNAENARQASTLATSSRESASKGDMEVGEIATAMTSMQAAGKEIANIVKLIDDIAFQTNLLALNAAVEAARAGRHGKGFAVVAEEVRSLAGRSAKAAHETAELVDDTIRQITNVTGIVERTQDTLKEIVTGSVSMEDLVGEIASASSEQAQAIMQVGAGLRQIEKATQLNTASAEQTASSAEELTGHARNLLTQVQRFRIREAQQHMSFSQQNASYDVIDHPSQAPALPWGGASSEIQL